VKVPGGSETAGEILRNLEENLSANLPISLECYLVAHYDISLLLKSIICPGHRAKTIDNSLYSGIIFSIK
jgi:hypothetical protein